MKLILLFLSTIYYLITSIRNWMYNIGFLSSKRIKNTISIVVGNLSTGGTGKSPMVIFLVQFLKQKGLVAILSRGYKRKTKGFKIVNKKTSTYEVGDEAMQFFNRFKNNVIIAVCENRFKAAEKIKKKWNPNFLILDDGYQHREFDGTFNILLTDYSMLYSSDYLLPYGNLRESKVFAKRAHCIIVTKCPKYINNKKKNKLLKN